MVAYLRELGVSDIYASPIFHARSGSMHGYDIVDPNRINPDLGSEQEFASLIDQAHRYDLGCHAHAGDAFTARVVEEVSTPGGWLAIPVGATGHGTITEVSAADNTRSTGTLTLAVSSVTVAGSRYDIDASIDALETVNEGRGIETVDAARVVGGAAAGAILGRVIGGNAKGTIIGGVAGGATGADVSVVMKDMDIVLPAGSRLRLTLRQPLSLPAR